MSRRLNRRARGAPRQQGGLKGGRTRAERLAADERSAIARKAAQRAGLTAASGRFPPSR